MVLNLDFWVGVFFIREIKHFSEGLSHSKHLTARVRLIYPNCDGMWRGRSKILAENIPDNAEEDSENSIYIQSQHGIQHRMNNSCGSGFACNYRRTRCYCQKETSPLPPIFYLLYLFWKDKMDGSKNRVQSIETEAA